MSDKDLIEEARRLENDYGDNYEVVTHMSALADALAARQPTEGDREALEALRKAHEAAGSMPQGTMDHETQWLPFANLYNAAERVIDSRAAVPDAATEVAYADLAAERDDLEERLAGFLCDSTGGLLSKTGYDVRTMVAHTEDYYDKVHAEARKEVEAERDAALAAIERVKEILSLHNPNGRLVKEVLAALDGAPEPEEKA